MTTSQDLLAMVFGALTDKPGTTDAGARTYGPGDWPSQSDQYPLLKLRLASENRQSLGRSGAPQFTTTATIEIVGETSADAEIGNAGAVAAQNSLWVLKRQVEVAIINSYPLTREIQQIASINSTTGFDSTGATHLAALYMQVVFEFYEGAEDFAPIETTPIEQMHLHVTTSPAHPGFTVDLPQ